MWRPRLAFGADAAPAGLSYKLYVSPATGELKGVLLVTALVTLFFFLLPGPVVGSAELAASSLFLR